MSLLGEIVKHKRVEVSSRTGARRRTELRRHMADLEPTRGFDAALRRGGDPVPRLIAEIKKASPSKGLIRADFDPVRLARSYRTAGAHALSVLTDQAFFQGDPVFLRAVREAVDMLAAQKMVPLSRYEAYSLVSMVGDCRVSQVVDVRKGVHCMIPKSAFRNK